MANKDNNYIYTLSCPFTDSVRYVGCSSNPKSRLSGHLSASASPRVKEWIKQLGTDPVMDIVDCASAANRTQVEQYWIQQFQSWGFPLLNVQGLICSIARRKEIIKKHKKSGLIYNRHKNLMCRADATKISAIYGLSMHDTRNALYKGIFTEETLRKVTAFYEDKWSRVRVSRNFYFIPDKQHSKKPTT